MELARRTFPTVPVGATLVVPVGSVEQHGPHLPLTTDTTIATAVANTVATLPNTELAPAIEFGASGEHEGFAGTVSIGSAALELVLVELGRSACRWARRLCLVNGHGGNASALVNAVKLLRYEGRDVAWLPCAIPGADAHAGYAETALMLHLRTDSVDLDAAEPGNTDPIADLLPRLRNGGLAAVTTNGVLGDPTGASADEGERLFADLCDRARTAYLRWQPDETGRLR